MINFNKVDVGKLEAKPCAEAAGSPLITLPQWPFSWPSPSAMRAYVHRAEELGLNEAFVRVGRRVLVDPQKFFVLIRNLEKPISKEVNCNANHTGTIAKRPRGQN